MTSLFAAAGLEDEAPRPLADRLRPQSLDEVVGQDHLVGPDGTLSRMLRAGRLISAILWGPPGTGKTTIARLLAHEAGTALVQMSAIFSGVQELKRVFDVARARREQGQGTVLFVDEIHRFNRAQQDSFLPVVENGVVTLIGATTQNPSLELNSALLSRVQVLTLNRLDEAALNRLLDRAQNHESRPLPIDETAIETLVAMADGDGRYLLNMVEDVYGASGPGAEPLDRSALAALVHKRAPVYDKNRDGHYHLISALHKAVRGSDPDAALYYLARMLVAGEDPLYIARRLVRMAVEDIGLADPQAIVQANAAKQAYEFLGSPEGELALAQAVIYLATSPKSNAVYKAFAMAGKRARQTGSLSPPKPILNAATRLMREQGYGRGYRYDHDAEEAFSGQNYFPEDMGREVYYQPSRRGFETEIAKRLAHWARLRKQHKS
ncbi:MAG: replication-associated recombination protein A [Hyphomicrobiales bacterium]